MLIDNWTSPIEASHTSTIIQWEAGIFGLLWQYLPNNVTYLEGAVERMDSSFLPDIPHLERDGGREGGRGRERERERERERVSEREREREREERERKRSLNIHAYIFKKILLLHSP